MPEPLVGIWWDDGKRRVVLAHPLGENVTGEVLVDSNLKHVVVAGTRRPTL
ncbi:MAG: hypothetical protein H0T47_16685 [Planctomycetaceae bacterium]|nr:hypothetical protein [Planctomycetaceae bacterium]